MKEKKWNTAGKVRMRIQVYGSHEHDTLACIELLRKANTGYMMDPDRGPRWPSPTEVNRLAVEHYLKSLKSTK